MRRLASSQRLEPEIQNTLQQSRYYASVRAATFGFSRGRIPCLAFLLRCVSPIQPRSPKIRRGGLQPISSTEVSGVVPRAPRGSGPRHALVHRIGPTRRTSAGRSRQALLIGLKPAIRGSSSPSIINDTPRTVGRSGFLKADDGRKNTKDEHENFHGNLRSRRD